MKFSKILLGESQIYPGDYNWTLYTETNFKSSSYGGFRTMGWYTSGSPSYIGFNTSEGYIYSTGTHSQVKISPQVNDLNRFLNAKAIKIVFDGIYVARNSNTYGTDARIAGFGLTSKQSNFGYADAGTMTGTGCEPSVWYSGYSIIEKDGDYNNWICYLNNGSVFTCTNTGWQLSNILTTSNWFNSATSDSRGWCAKLATDQTSAMGYTRMKDIHLYLAE